MLTHMSDTQVAPLAPQFGLKHRLALALEVACLDRDQMAAELGVHKNTITNYMRGHTVPSRGVLIAWALRTGVPFEWLLTGHLAEGGPGQGTSMARCIRGPWSSQATGVLDEEEDAA